MSREPEYKDKIEVSLDGRQIFYLFFGGAVIVGLVFVVGVMVGRRVEARGHVDRAQTSATSDPLAALDQLEASRPPLGFKSALAGHPQATEVEHKIEAVEKAKEDKRAQKAGKSDKDKADKADKPGDPKKPGDKKPDAKKPDASAKADDKPAKASDEHPAVAAARPAKADKGSDKPIDKSDKADKDDDKKVADADKKPAKKPEAETSKFTLQLSSFQDKHEAEAFLASMKASGYEPYLTETEITGKGTFYRVRLGTYRSLEAANDAKAEYEKTAKKSASVMRL